MTMRLRNRVRPSRQGQGLSQAELARRARVSRQTLSNIEQDNGYEPRSDVMRRLAETIGDPGLFWWQADDDVRSDDDVE